MKAIAFLGGGRITTALLAGLRLAKYDKPIIVYDHHPQKLRRLKEQYAVMTEKNLARAIERALLVIIAVRPASVGKLLHEIGPMNRPLNAVSLAAGIPLSSLRSRLGPPARWGRAMPSPVCRSGRGLTALAFGRDFPLRAKSEVRNLFAKVGPILEVPESRFDAFTVTYSCSHGYHALATLASAAEKFGLDRNSALTAAAHALADGIVAWREGAISLAHLLNEAATPGGISAAVLESLGNSGYKNVIQKGLRAGMKRARGNAKLL